LAWRRSDGSGLRLWQAEVQSRDAKSWTSGSPAGVSWSVRLEPSACQGSVLAEPSQLLLLAATSSHRESLPPPKYRTPRSTQLNATITTSQNFIHNPRYFWRQQVSHLARIPAIGDNRIPQLLRPSPFLRSPAATMAYNPYGGSLPYGSYPPSQSSYMSAVPPGYGPPPGYPVYPGAVPGMAPPPGLGMSPFLTTCRFASLLTHLSRSPARHVFCPRIGTASRCSAAHECDAS
jgi:hypothetical protein